MHVSRGVLPVADTSRPCSRVGAENLVLANVGNGFHWLYVVNLPAGPIWLLHTFYTIVSAMMLFWYLRYHRA